MARKRGGQSTYTPEIAEQICRRLAAGETLRQVCLDDGMPTEATVRLWAVEDIGGFASQYTRARDIGIDCKADQLLSIAGDTARDPNCRRVEIDALKWYLCKLAPKRYGERLELASDPKNPLIPPKIVVEFVEPKKPQ
jgi:hypothetical protein